MNNLDTILDFKAEILNMEEFKQLEIFVEEEMFPILSNKYSIIFFHDFSIL